MYQCVISDRELLKTSLITALETPEGSKEKKSFFQFVMGLIHYGKKSDGSWGCRKTAGEVYVPCYNLFEPVAPIVHIMVACATLEELTMASRSEFFDRKDQYGNAPVRYAQWGGQGSEIVKFLINMARVNQEKQASEKAVASRQKKAPSPGGGMEEVYQELLRHFEAFLVEDAGVLNFNLDLFKRYLESIKDDQAVLQLVWLIALQNREIEGYDEVFKRIRFSSQDDFDQKFPHIAKILLKAVLASSSDDLDCIEVQRHLLEKVLSLAKYTRASDGSLQIKEPVLSNTEFFEPFATQAHIRACYRRDAEEYFTPLVSSYSPDLHAQDESGNNLLHYAIWSGQSDSIIQLLLESGLDPHHQNRSGLSPIALALYLNDRKIIQCMGNYLGKLSNEFAMLGSPHQFLLGLAAQKVGDDFSVFNWFMKEDFLSCLNEPCWDDDPVMWILIKNQFYPTIAALLTQDKTDQIDVFVLEEVLMTNPKTLERHQLIQQVQQRKKHFKSHAHKEEEGVVATRQEGLQWELAGVTAERDCLKKELDTLKKQQVGTEDNLYKTRRANTDLKKEIESLKLAQEENLQQINSLRAEILRLQEKLMAQIAQQEREFELFKQFEQNRRRQLVLELTVSQTEIIPAEIVLTRTVISEAVASSETRASPCASVQGNMDGMKLAMLAMTKEFKALSATVTGLEQESFSFRSEFARRFETGETVFPARPHIYQPGPHSMAPQPAMLFGAPQMMMPYGSPRLPLPPMMPMGIYPTGFSGTPI